MEAFAPVLADRMDLLLDYVPAGGIVLACDPERIRARAEDLVRTSQEFLEASWVNAAAGGEAPIDLGPSAFQPISRVREAAAELGLPWWTIAPFGVTDGGPDEPEPGVQPGLGTGEPGAKDRASFRINASPSPSYRGDSDRMLTDIRDWLADDWRVVLVTEGPGPAQRLAEMLRGEGIGARLPTSAIRPSQASPTSPRPGSATVSSGQRSGWFCSPRVTWPAIRPGSRRPGTCAGCRAAGAAAWTRCSCMPGTTWCTSSTVSAATWR